MARDRIPVRLAAAVAAVGTIAAAAVSMATGTDPLPTTATAHVQAAEAAAVTSCQVVTGNNHIMDLRIQQGDAVTPYLGTFTYASKGVTASHGSGDPRTITIAGGVTAGKATFGFRSNLPIDVLFVSSRRHDGSIATWRYTYTQYTWGGHPATGPFEDSGIVAPGATISSLLFCTIKKVRVEVSAAPTFTRAHTWKVENAVVGKADAAPDDPGFGKAATLDLETGSSANATWRVTTTRTGSTDSGFALGGEIAILNASPFVLDLRATFGGVPGAQLSGPCATAGPIAGVQRGATVRCAYAAPSLASGATLTPTLGVTFGDKGLGFLDGTGSATAAFTTPTTELHRSVRWIDSIDPGTAVNGQRGNITGSPDVVTYQQQRLCDRDRGTESITVRLFSEDTGAFAFNTDTSKLTVRCTTPVKPLVVANDAARLDWKRVNRWTIAETAVPPSHALQPGQTGISSWNIDVEKAGADDFILLTGAFEVRNPNTIAIGGVTVSKPVASATVLCAVGAWQPASVEGRTFSIPAGESLRCSWSVDRATAEGGSTPLTVTSAVTPEAGVTTTVSWSGRVEPNLGDVNATVLVDDDRTPQQWNATTSTDGDRSIPETFPCANAASTNVPRILGDDPATPAVETAFVLGSATATVTTTCDTTPPVDRRIDVGVGISAPAELPLGAGGTTPFEYGYVFRNGGPSPATNVVAVSTAPAGVTFLAVVQQPAQGSCAIQAVPGPGGGTTLRCELGTLAPGQALEGIRVSAVATGTGSFTQVVTITGEGGLDTNPLDNTAVARTVVVGPPTTETRIDVAVGITAPAQLDQGAGGQTGLDYTLTFRNNGPDAATEVAVTNTAPPGVVYIGVTRQPSQGSCTPVNEGRGLACTLGTLAPGQVLESVVVAARASGSGSFTNIVAIDGRGGPDTNLANNVAQARTVIVAPATPATTPVPDPHIDTAVTITAPGQLVQGAGGTTALEYTLTFRNNGPNQASSVVATSTAPPGVTYTAVTRQPSQGTCAIADAGRALRCELGTLTVGQVLGGVVVSASATGTGTFTAVVAIDGQGGPDTNPLNNTAQAQTLVIAPTTPPVVATPRIDIEVRHGAPAKVVIESGSTSATYGYTYLFRNNGPNTSTGVVTQTTAPKGVTFVSITRQPAQGICKISAGGKRITCRLGTMRAGTSLDLRVDARVRKPGVYRTVVTGEGKGGTDTNLGNNRATAQVVVVAEARPVVPEPPTVQCYAPRASVRTIPAARSASVTFTVVGSNGSRLPGARLRVLGPGIDRVLHVDGSGRVAANLEPNAGGIITVSVVGVKQCSEARIGVIVPREPIVTG